MDYMLVLPFTKHGNDYVFLVVNQFSNMAILISYKLSIIVGAATKVLFKHILLHFMTP